MHNILLIFLLLSFNSIAQNTIKGVVFHNNSEIEGVNISYLNSKLVRTTTNKFGEFEIYKQNNNDTIVIKRNGFVPVYTTVKALITDPENNIIKELPELPEVLQKEKETGIKEIPKEKVIDYLASGNHVYISKWHFSSTTFKIYKNDIIQHHEYNGVKKIYKDKIGNIYLYIGDLFYKTKFENGRLENLETYKKKTFSKLLADNKIQLGNNYFKLIVNNNENHIYFLKQNLNTQYTDTVYSIEKGDFKTLPSDKGKEIVNATTNNYFLYSQNDTIFLFDNMHNTAVLFNKNGNILSTYNFTPSGTIEQLKYIVFDDVLLQPYYIFENEYGFALQKLNCSSLKFEYITTINKLAEKPMVMNNILYYLISNYEEDTRKLIKENLKKQDD